MIFEGVFGMKVVILAGGLGTRISEETHLKPKPMIEIGGKPILWHIMKIYSAHGFNDFVVCLGYKGYVVKEYFSNYFLHNSDVTFNLADNKMEVHKNKIEPWKVTLVDTGDQTLTGGRIKRIKDYVGNEDFLMTYGDGVGNINIRELVAFHKRSNTLATLTATNPAGRFGVMDIDPETSKILNFWEKPSQATGSINGGFFVLSPKVFNYIEDDNTIWERAPLENLAKDGQLAAYQHTGFWLPMDTLRDKNQLEELWSSKAPPWKVWEE